MAMAINGPGFETPKVPSSSTAPTEEGLRLAAGGLVGSMGARRNILAARPSEAFLNWLSSRSADAVSAAVVALVLIFGLLDYATGYEVSFAFFYVLPVALAAWSVGGRLAVLISLLSAATWHFANLFAGEKVSQPWISYWNMATRLESFLLTGFLITRLREALDRERDLSRRDSLTGLANSRAFQEAASAELLRSSRHGRRFTVAALDLDDFKLVNDRLGTPSETWRSRSSPASSCAAPGGPIARPESAATSSRSCCRRRTTTWLAP